MCPSVSVGYSPHPVSPSLRGPLVAGLVVAALHLAVAATTSFDYFRDELYYLACSHHLASGYVDHPPLSIWLLAVVRTLLGDGLLAIRVVPAVASGLTVGLTGLLAREFGGDARGMTLAAIATAAVPVQRAMGSYYSMNAIDIMLWPLAAWLLLRALALGGTRRWLWLGLVLGAGLLNKVSVLWMGAGIGFALLVDHRQALRTRGPWLAAALALTCFAPFIAWNMTHDFAHLEFMRNAVTNKYASQSARTFVVEQVMQQHPVLIPVWAAGLWFYFTKAGRAFRTLGWIVVVTFVVLLANGHSKPEYIAPAYTLLFAAGGVMLGRWLRGPRRWLLPAYATLVVALAIVPLPTVVPMLSVDRTVAWSRAIGIAPATAEGKALGRLGQFFADMLGWREKAEAVAEVFHALPPADRARAALFADNYGRAGAIDHYGRALGLPAAISLHNNYWLWGPRDATGDIVIILGGNPESHRRAFATVELAGRVTCPDCMPYEADLGIYVCRGSKRPLTEAWPGLKHFD